MPIIRFRDSSPKNLPRGNNWMVIRRCASEGDRHGFIFIQKSLGHSLKPQCVKEHSSDLTLLVTESPQILSVS